MDGKENSQELNKKEREKKQQGYEFDDLLRLTGGFGRYQMALYTFVCLISIPTGAQLLVQVFYGASPRFSCVSMPANETCAPGKCCSNCDKYEFQGPFTSAVSEVVYVDFTVTQRNPNSKSTTSHESSQCRVRGNYATT